jgi:hypothetical protein
MWSGLLRSIMCSMPATDITIRMARPADERALTNLSELDSSRRPEGSVLVAEVNGSLWAAVSLDDRRAVADPFRPSAEVLTLLHERAHQMRSHAPRRIGAAGRHGLVRFPARSFTGEP